ncbi:transposase [Pyramidobacter porci]
MKTAEASRERGGSTTAETSMRKPLLKTIYFISSLKNAQAKDLLRITREHWAIENNLHWMLDMAFWEDDCRARAKNAAEVMNFADVENLQRVQMRDEEQAQALRAWHP